MRPRALRPEYAGGYLRVGLRGAGRQTTVLVHRLVAEAFLGHCPTKLEVNHKNGHKRDNRRENLEYATHQENMAHAAALGLMAKGLRNGAHTHPEKWQRGDQHWMRKRRLSENATSSVSVTTT